MNSARSTGSADFGRFLGVFQPVGDHRASFVAPIGQQWARVDQASQRMFIAGVLIHSQIQHLLHYIACGWCCNRVRERSARPLSVASVRFVEESLLATESAVQAGWGDAHRRGELADRRAASQRLLICRRG